ncbi:hypothetical protein [Marinagarivorans cellulosilyticus]|uniref:hypothetical protein n=1 Tax=Marinagarivorans cellulosilyticus TaxID=2721545 RepID=UPI001F292416|nr:hypothetical protein [Marinagarivorans cellulosilyticus]
MLFVLALMVIGGVFYIADNGFMPFGEALIVIFLWGVIAMLLVSVAHVSFVTAVDALRTGDWK